MPVKNTASALGEAIGKLIEDELENILRPICEEYKYIYDRGGSRPRKRKGVSLNMINASGNKYKLDAIIENPDENPVILIESKYLRYKKHNRDKASWTCASHYSLRKTHPTVRKSIAVLSGRWSEPSKVFLQSFGIEFHHIDFPLMCAVMNEFGMDFDWPEDNQDIPDSSWNRFSSLSSEERQELSRRLVNPVRSDLSTSIITTIESGEDWPQRLQELELLLKTDRNEYFTKSFPSTRETIEYLLTLQEESQDLRGRLSGDEKNRKS